MEGDVEMTTCPACGETKTRRGDAHHRLFFAVIAKAWDSWPESAKFQPETPEHLRSYLLIKAGHFDKLDIRCDNPDAISLEDQLRVIIKTVSDKPPLMHSYQWGVRVFWPKSISYAACDRRTFNEVSTKVFEILETMLGVPIETLKKEAEREAA